MMFIRLWAVCSGCADAAGERRALPHDSAVRASVRRGERRVHEERCAKPGQQVHLKPRCTSCRTTAALGSMQNTARRPEAAGRGVTLTLPVCAVTDSC